MIGVNPGVGGKKTLELEVKIKGDSSDASRAMQDVVAYPIQYTNQVYARSASVDYGHELKSVIQLYPGIDETTHFVQ